MQIKEQNAFGSRSIVIAALDSSLQKLTTVPNTECLHGGSTGTSLH